MLSDFVERAGVGGLAADGLDGRNGHYGLDGCCGLGVPYWLERLIRGMGVGVLVGLLGE